ncbi:MAG: polysaccharide pyruvyl transferase family protein [Balneolales bacterium]
MKRRKFIQQVGIVGSGAILAPGILKAVGKDNPTLLVVSGWQDVNIGDITHTPGLLHILETYIPHAKIILWKKSRGNINSEAVETLLNKNFPRVKVIYGNVDEDKNVSSKELLDAFSVSDIMIHGSGPSVVGRVNLQAWYKNTGKPFGIFGTTIQHINPELKTLLEKASFIYTRETKSLDVLKEAGINRNNSFAPDGTFFLNIHDEQTANKFLKDNNLEEKKFICAIPRLRITPYYDFKPNHNYSDERIQFIEDLNERKKEWDHAKLREAMITWVRETGNKVLVCPEMTYQVEIMDELLIDPLPDDVKPYVIKRGYWMPDVAASVYAKAHTVLSFECHSPIIAAANGTPFFYLRQPEDTIKGHMYYDLNFNDWIFEIEDTEGKQISDQLMKIWGNYSSAQQYIKINMSKVAQIYSDSCDLITTELKI